MNTLTFLPLPNPLGDLLLAFNSQPPWPQRCSTSGWQWLADRRPGFSGLWTSPVNQDWKGFPTKSWQLPGWQFYLLGEAPPSTALADLEDLALQQDSLGSQMVTASLNSWNRRFLVFAFENRLQRWHAWTDRFGTLHAYYAWDGVHAALGTYAPAVAAAASQRQLDWKGLSGFFALGFFPGERTHYQDLHILRPASHYTFETDGHLACQEPYWKWQHQPDTTRSYQESLSEFAHIFQDLLQEQTAQGRVAIPISGGLDSRSTVAALTEPRQAPDERLWSYSYGYSDDSIETRIARQVAQARNLPFQAYTIQHYLFEQIKPLLDYTEGFQDLTQARQVFIRQELAERSDVLVAALWGDVWLDEMGLAAFLPGSLTSEQILDHTLKKMLKRGRNWLLEHLAAPQLEGSDPGSLVTDLVRSELAAFESIEEPDFRVKAFKTWQWSHRWSLPSQRAFQSAAWPALIFYDHRISDFFGHIPTKWLSGRQFQIDYLKLVAPDLARVKWQVYDANLYHYQHYNTWLLPKRAMQKAWRKLTKQTILHRNWEVQFLCPQGQAGFQRWLLRPSLRLHEFISPPDLEDLLENFYAAQHDPSLGYPLSMLLTFSAWLELHA